jgi:hypothetical protein
MPLINIKNRHLNKTSFPSERLAEVYLGKLGNTQHIVMDKNSSDYES